MEIVRTGNWNGVRSVISNTSNKLHKSLRVALRHEAEYLRKLIVEGLTKQAPGGEQLKDLSPLTLAARQLAGFRGTKALMNRGDLRRSISVVMKGDEAFIGVLRKAKGKDGKPVADIAKINEFGSDPIVVPITPKMRRFLFVLFKQAGLTPSGGRGKGVVVFKIPPRPFLRPAFKQFQSGAHERFQNRVSKLIGVGNGR